MQLLTISNVGLDFFLEAGRYPVKRGRPKKRFNVVSELREKELFAGCPKRHTLCSKHLQDGPRQIFDKERSDTKMRWPLVEHCQRHSRVRGQYTLSAINVFQTSSSLSMSALIVPASLKIPSESTSTRCKMHGVDLSYS